MTKSHTLGLGLSLLLALHASSQPVLADQSPASSTEWWREAKFGLFIHWGPVSLQGTEIGWSRAGERRGLGWGGPGTEVPVEVYDSLYKRFNPIRFDAGEWARIASEAGMKYVVLTTRHHDGFSLWDTQASSYKITAPECPFGRDVVRELSEATRKAGLRWGVYYSQPDWHHPDAYTRNHSRYQAYLQDQLRELLGNYGKVDILWYDGLGDHREEYRSAEMNALARKLQPSILINNRNGFPEDFDTPEQRVGQMQVGRPWETNMTLCQQWSWRPNDTMKSLEECLRILVTTVTGDGNLLFNVGPMPDGRIEPRQVERLREIGAWLGKNGTAVYRTRGGPWVNGAWGGSTHRGDRIFVFLLRKPAGGVLTLSGNPGRVLKASLLGSSQAVTFSQEEKRLSLQVPASAFGSPIPILELQLAEPVVTGRLLGQAGMAFEDESLYGKPRKATASTVPASAASLQESDAGWSIDMASGPAPALVFDLGEPRLITGLSAVSGETGAFAANHVLELEMSLDGKTWESVGQASYGLPSWEFPVVHMREGAEHIGRSFRYVRLEAKQGEGRHSLHLRKVRIFAK